MTRGEAWFTHASTLLVGASGLVYGWMRYFVQPEDPYAVVNHPAQPFVLHLHVVVAPLSVFALGLLWRSHVWDRLRSGFRARRRTGLVLALTVFPMIASGYLLQVAESELARRIWIAVHLGASIVWLAVYLVHQLAPRHGRGAG